MVEMFELFDYITKPHQTHKNLAREKIAVNFQPSIDEIGALPIGNYPIAPQYHSKDRLATLAIAII